MSLYPLVYAGGEIKELNIGLMPCLVTSYEQGFAWRSAEIGRQLVAAVEDAGVKILTWIRQAGGIASRVGAIVDPEDVKGVKVRGGSREFDLMFKSAGGIVSSVPSNEIQSAMETGALDAAVTSSTSLLSFHLEDISKHLTTGRGQSFWFMFEPLLISKTVFDGLTPHHQAIMTEVGESLVTFGLASAKADDAVIAEVFAAKGAKIHDMGEATIDRWRSIAIGTSWRDFAARSPACARFLSLAQDIKV
jgi:TRAP-type C4-dicarboxylate transport system substrate-binding protein